MKLLDAYAADECIFRVIVIDMDVGSFFKHPSAKAAPGGSTKQIPALVGSFFLLVEISVNGLLRYFGLDPSRRNPAVNAFCPSTNRSVRPVNFNAASTLP
jgi:hypothetical protein